MQYMTPVYLCLPEVTRSHQATLQFVQKLEETGTVNKGEKDAKKEEKEREEADKEANINKRQLNIMHGSQARLNPLLPPSPLHDVTISKSHCKSEMFLSAISLKFLSVIDKCTNPTTSVAAIAARQLADTDTRSLIFIRRSVTL